MKICQHYQATSRNGDFLFREPISLESSGPKIGFGGIRCGSNILVGLTPLNGWFLGDF